MSVPNENDKVYSINNQDFDYVDIFDAAEIIADDDDELFPGDLLTIYEGEVDPVRPELLIRRISEQIEEAAFDLYHDLTDDWRIKDDQSLQDYVARAIAEWFEANPRNKPNFYAVKNVKPVRLRVLGLDPFDFERVDETEEAG